MFCLSATDCIILPILLISLKEILFLICPRVFVALVLFTTEIEFTHVLSVDLILALLVCVIEMCWANNHQNVSKATLRQTFVDMFSEDFNKE